MYFKKSKTLTMEDHKQNFTSAIQCHVINTNKPELHKTSKLILRNVNKENEIWNNGRWEISYELVQIYKTKLHNSVWYKGTLSIFDRECLRLFLDIS